MITITYGSQTGNSESIAKKVSKGLSEINVNNQLLSLNLFLSKLEKMNKDEIHIFVVICSTTGNGDVPDNADKFLRYIKRKTHPNNFLSNFYYAVLGLGDSNYSKYQYIPRQVDDLLSKIGAKRFMKKVEADECGGLENVVEPWIKFLYEELQKLLVLHSGKETEPISQESDERVGKIELEDSKQRKIKKGDEKTHFLMNVVTNELISGESSAQEIYKLKLSKEIKEYLPGSSLQILPKNSDDVMKKIKNCLIINNDDILTNSEFFFNFSENYPQFNIFRSNSVINSQDILSYFIDFTCIPSETDLKNILSVLNGSDEKNKEFLRKLIEKYEFIQKNKISLLEIIQKLENFEISLNNLLLNFPKLYPRSYSLSSSSNDEHLEIIFSCKQEHISRPDNEFDFARSVKFRGICSNFLSKITTQSLIFVSNISNSFGFPKEIQENKNPLIYICNGTGISPMISYLSYLKSNINNIHILPQIRIFSGFRSDSTSKSEIIEESRIKKYISDINTYQGQESLKYNRCLSQDSSIDEEEIGVWRNFRINTDYVQDLLMVNKEEVFDLVFQKKGFIMMCGNIDKLYDECLKNLSEIFNEFKSVNGFNGYSIENILTEGKLIIEKWNK